LFAAPIPIQRLLYYGLVHTKEMLIVYTKTGCPWCRDALKFLSDKRTPCEEREVRGSAAYFAELKEKSGQEKTPTLDLDGAILADVGVDEIAGFLREKGVI